MKVKDIPKFERLNILITGGQQCGTQSAFGINVLELNGNSINTNPHKYELWSTTNRFTIIWKSHCLITNVHCLINKSSHIKHVCRRCLTAFSSEPVLLDHMEKCINQQPTNITFSWKDHLQFEDHHMKVNDPIRRYADFECIKSTNSKPQRIL